MSTLFPLFPPVQMILYAARARARRPCHVGRQIGDMMFCSKLILSSTMMICLLSYSTFAQTKGKYNVRDYGATGDGTTKDTVAFQKALDICAVSGGGDVIVPAGK